MPENDEAITLELDRNMRTGNMRAFCPPHTATPSYRLRQMRKSLRTGAPAIKSVAVVIGERGVRHHYRSLAG